jgi:hypothetical protein
MCTYLPADDPENISSDPFMGLRYLRSRYGRESAGIDTVGGYHCERYAIKKDGKTLVSYWEAKALRFPLRIVEHSASDITTAVSAVVEGDIDDTVFTVPDDYTILAQRWQP